MKFFSATQIIARYLKRRSTKEIYWDLSEIFCRLACLLVQRKNHYANIVARDQLRFLFRKNQPIQGETLERANAAVKWLFMAQDATSDDGVSLGYFPCDNHGGNGWRPSYPETTGYIIQSLLDYADQYHDEEAQSRALRMALWEAEIQMPSGAVQGGTTRPPGEQTAATFNTGMVLQGYTSSLIAEKNDAILTAAYKAADFLVTDLDEDGHFRTHGDFVTHEEIKTYNCLCAWALYRFGNYVNDIRYKEAALCSIEAAIMQQHENGWFSNNCLNWPEAPLLHTIGYTLQGILEVGVLTSNSRFIGAVQKGVDPLLKNMATDGFLHGRFFANWKPACFSSCLTGNAQLAIVCYRLYQTTGDNKYIQAADHMINFLKPLQILDSPNQAVNGAIAGSFPMMGHYMSTGYPNWATKYFLDALLLQDQLSNS